MMIRPCCKSEFQRPSGPTAFAFSAAFVAVAISSSVGSIPRALPTGCCDSLFGMSGYSVQQRAEESQPTFLVTDAL